MIRTEQDGDIALIILDRPDKRNALTPDMLDALAAAVMRTASGPARAVVLAGEGPVFCGGFDLKMCLERPGTLGSLLMGLAGLITVLRQMPRPVVIAAHGGAIAGGCALLTAADVVVADEGARIGYPVVPLGISPAVSAAGLRLAVGDGSCRERLLDPALVSARDAARIGLVHEVVPGPGDVRPRALESARALASKPPGAYSATKGWLREIEASLGPAEAQSMSLNASMAIVGSAEETERLARLFAKGKP